MAQGRSGRIEEKSLSLFYFIYFIYFVVAVATFSPVARPCMVRARPWEVQLQPVVPRHELVSPCLNACTTVTALIKEFRHLSGHKPA